MAIKLDLFALKAHCQGRTVKSIDNFSFEGIEPLDISAQDAVIIEFTDGTILEISAEVIPYPYCTPALQFYKPELE